MRILSVQGNLNIHICGVNTVFSFAVSVCLIINVLGQQHKSMVSKESKRSGIVLFWVKMIQCDDS